MSKESIIHKILEMWSTIIIDTKWKGRMLIAAISIAIISISLAIAVDIVNSAVVSNIVNLKSQNK